MHCELNGDENKEFAFNKQQQHLTQTLKECFNNLPLHISILNLNKHIFFVPAYFFILKLIQILLFFVLFCRTAFLSSA